MHQLGFISFLGFEYVHSHKLMFHIVRMIFSSNIWLCDLSFYAMHAIWGDVFHHRILANGLYRSNIPHRFAPHRETHSHTPFNVIIYLYQRSSTIFPTHYTHKSQINSSPAKSTPIAVAPGEKWTQGKLQFMLSQRGKPLLVHDGHSFGIQYIRKDKKYWQCNLSRKFNCKARVTTTETGEIIVTNNEHCHTEIRQHLRKDYKHQKNAGWPDAAGSHPPPVSVAAAASTSANISTSGDTNNGGQHSDFMRQIVSTAATASMAVNRMIVDSHQRQLLAAAEAVACANPPPAHQIHSHHPTWPYKNGLDA